MKRTLLILVTLALATVTTACNDFDTPSFAKGEAQIETNR